MTITRRNNENIEEAAEKLANELADRPYGKTKDKLVFKGIKLPYSWVVQIEDAAYRNKRNNKEPKTFSAFIIDAISKYIELKGFTKNE